MPGAGDRGRHVPKYGGMDVSEARGLREIEQENRRLEGGCLGPSVPMSARP